VNKQLESAKPLPTDLLARQIKRYEREDRATTIRRKIVAWAILMAVPAAMVALMAWRVGQ